MRDYYVVRDPQTGLRRGTKAEAEKNGWDHWQPFETADLDLTSNLYLNTPHLSANEQKKLFEQTGVVIKDKDDLRRYHQAHGTRCVEAGELQDRQLKDMKEWAASGGSARHGKNLPESCRPAPVKNPIDIRQIYREIRESGQYSRSSDED